MKTIFSKYISTFYMMSSSVLQVGKSLVKRTNFLDIWHLLLDIWHLLLVVLRNKMYGYLFKCWCLNRYNTNCMFQAGYIMYCTVYMIRAGYIMYCTVYLIRAGYIMYCTVYISEPGTLCTVQYISNKSYCPVWTSQCLM